MTARELITDALLDLDVIGHGMTPSDDDAQLCLRKLNRLTRSLRLNRLWLHEVAVVSKTLIAGTAAYTMGVGASISTLRPNFAPQRAGLVLDPSLSPPFERPLQILTPNEWAAISQKDLQSTYPSAIYPDFAFNALGYSSLYVWPVPSTSVPQLRLYQVGDAVAEFATLDTEYEAPDGYDRALLLKLMEEIAPTYTRTLSELQMKLLAEAMDLVETVNNRPVFMRADEVTALARGHHASGAHDFDIRTGQAY